MRDGLLLRILPFAAPAVLLGAISVFGATYEGGTVFCAPPSLGFDLPSDRAIPAEVEVPGMKRDATWRFRYAPIGTEWRSGIPYWIFRALPRMFPEDLDGRGYAKFGFQDDDDHAYYKSRPVPRGLTLSDTEVHLPLFHLELKLKRVAFNCSSCHRGGYRDPADGEVHLVDGMPNHTADLQGFKRFFFDRFHDPRFNAESVIAAVDAELDAAGAPPLDARERRVYRVLVEIIRTSPTGRWMDSRAPNGPGRLDAFNAVKIEVLGVPDDGTAATVDFPALWNQATEREGAALRSWHHWDGNTADSRARNFGSTVGVGGIAVSVDKPGVLAVSAWTEHGLRPPPWPASFGQPDPGGVERGRALFVQSGCAGCHGLYDRERGVVGRVGQGDHYMKVVPVGTDDERQRSFPPAAAQVLGEFGGRRQLWGFGAFRGNSPERGGHYLCAPLDGIWARAPYLHNGSVPTLDALLGQAEARPKEFFRGSTTYDPVRVGFESDPKRTPEGEGRLFRFRTEGPTGPIPGNGNFGHAFVIADPEQRRDVIEYLKTL
jgi:mono/diheme cytochrome c family protein